MKCDDCLNLLEEYLDGEAAARDTEQVSAHLITCAACAHEFEALTAEREIYARYDRELAISPATWNAIAARTSEIRPLHSGERFSLGGWLAGLFATPRYAFAGAAAVVIFAVLIGVVLLRTRMDGPSPRTEIANVQDKNPRIAPVKVTQGVVTPGSVKVPTAPQKDPDIAQLKQPPTSTLRNPREPSRPPQSDVLDAAYTDIEDKDTAQHVAKAENLLSSVRNLQTSDDDEEVDVSYEKAESRRLLDNNVVLRRDAEMAGKYPVKKLLGELEPFLIDIANLPDKTTPTDLRAIKDRVEKTEIVAALRSY